MSSREDVRSDPAVDKFVYVPGSPEEKALLRKMFVLSMANVRVQKLTFTLQ